MITLSNISLRRGQHLLLHHVNWTIFHKQCIGLIGANGSGKSSLFALLLQHIPPDSGELDIPSRLKIAHVAQETPASSTTAINYVLEGDTELQHIEKALREAEKINDGAKIALLHAKMSEIDGYSAPARAAQLLNGLGFHAKEHHRPVSDFSGGWRIRLNLAKALMLRSDVLLLDEPTNHLDLDAVIWLETWLTHYKGTLLLISHDREFLDNVVDHIAHIEQNALKLYNGNYSSFEKQRAAQRLNQQAAFEKQQKKIAHLQSFIQRFKAKATKARQAQSRMKAIERMEILSAVQAESPFQFQFKEPEKCSNPLLTLINAEVSYGDRTILSQINLSIAPQDRIGLLGPNGAGKSSLIKLIAGLHCINEHNRQTGAGLKIGYFAQHQIDHLTLQQTPLDHLRKLAPGSKEVDLRTYLGSFGFSHDRTNQPVTHFSGGEKSRLALALLIWQKPNLLLLDEPTNHLDLEMREALSLALQDYEGAMILVSHDRFLVQSTTDQLLLVANGSMSSFDGDLTDYQQWLTQHRRQQEEMNGKVETNVVSKKAQRQYDAAQREMRRPLLTTLKKLEADLASLQTKLNAIELKLSEETLYQPGNKEALQQHLIEQANIKKQCQRMENDWLIACEQLESYDSDLKKES